MIVQQILTGAIMIAIGTVGLMFNYQLGNMVRLEWVESKIGYGSTFMVYKVFGVILVLAGVITLAGFGDDVLRWATSPLESVFNPD